MKIINKLIPITEKVENAEKLGQKLSSFSEDDQAMITMANEILQRILQIVFSAIKNDSVWTSMFLHYLYYTNNNYYRQIKCMLQIICQYY